MNDGIQVLFNFSWPSWYYMMYRQVDFLRDAWVFVLHGVWSLSVLELILDILSSTGSCLNDLSYHKSNVDRLMTYLIWICGPYDLYMAYYVKLSRRFWWNAFSSTSSEYFHSFWFTGMLFFFFLISPLLFDRSQDQACMTTAFLKQQWTDIRGFCI